MKFVLAFGIYFGVIFNVYSQGKILSGVVMDSTDSTKLIGAHVILISNWRVGATTDVNGEFQINIPDSLIDEQIQVSVSFVGYDESATFLSPGKYHKLFLKQNPGQLQTVTVEASGLFAEEFSVKKINRLEVYKNPSAKADPLLAVNSNPSATTLDESANVSFRGSSPSQTGIFLNGVPIYDAVRFSQLNGIGTFSLFNNEMLENIYIFPGNPPLEFGNVSSGLIALESTNKLSEHPSTSFVISPANISVNMDRPLGENTSIRVYSNYQPSAALKAMNCSALQDIKRFESVDLGVHFLYKNDKGEKIKLFNYSLSEAYKVRIHEPSFQGLLSQGRKRNMTTLNFHKPIGKGVMLINTGYSLSDLLMNFSETQYDVDSRNTFISINYQKEKKRSGYKLGISLDREKNIFNGTVPIYEYAIGPNHPHISLESKSERNVLETYVTYKYMPSEYISFGYALRSNIPLEDIPFYLSYQWNIHYNPKSIHDIKLSGGTQHQVEISQENDEFVLFNAKQYSLDHSLLLDQFSNTNSIFYKDIDAGSYTDEIVGIESSFKWRFKSRSFIEVSYTGLEATRIKDESYESPFDLNYFIRVGGEWALPSNWSLGLRGLFREGTFYSPVLEANFEGDLNAFRPIYAGNEDRLRLPSYNIVDLNVSKLIPVNEHLMMVFFASVSNVMDTKNVRGYSYNIDYTKREANYFSRRTYYLGLTVNFQ